MYENQGYEAANRASSIAGSLANAAKVATPRDKPRIEGSLDNMQKLLAVCYEGHARIQNATTRIVGATPEPPAGPPTAVRPAPCSIEDRITELREAVERLAEKLQNTASALDSAV